MSEGIRQKVTWKELKSIFSDIPQVLKQLVYWRVGKKYKMLLHYKGVLFESEVLINSEDGQDFEQNYKPKIQAGIDERGLPILSPTIADLPGNTKWTGSESNFDLKFTAIAGIENFFDIQLSQRIYLRGGGYVILNTADVHNDDYIEFSIIDKDLNNDGLSDVLGITCPVGSFVELSKFIKRWWVKGRYVYDFESESGEILVPGLFVRIGYRSFGTVNINFNGYLKIIENISEVI